TCLVGLHVCRRLLPPRQKTSSIALIHRLGLTVDSCGVQCLWPAGSRKSSAANLGSARASGYRQSMKRFFSSAWHLSREDFVRKRISLALFLRWPRSLSVGALWCRGLNRRRFSSPLLII